MQVGSLAPGYKCYLVIFYIAGEYGGGLKASADSLKSFITVQNREEKLP